MTSLSRPLKFIVAILFTIMLFTVPVTAQQDTDGDGVDDDVDSCPDTSGGESVDEYGCSDSQYAADFDEIFSFLGLVFLFQSCCGVVVIIFFINIGVKVLSSGRSVNTEPWVLKMFQIDNSGISGAHLFIEARKPGLMSFILNILELDDSASLKVTKGVISFRKSSLFGLVQTSTSLTQIASFQGGYSKPIIYLVLSFVSILFGVFLDIYDTDIFPFGSIVGAVFALLFLIIYALHKNLMFGFETSGGTYYGLAFKRGIIDGVSVNIEQVERALTMVNALIGAASLGTTYTETHNVTRYTKQGTVGAITPAPPTLVTPPPPTWKPPPPPPRN